MSKPFGRIVFADSTQPGEKFMVVRAAAPEGMRWMVVRQISMTTLQIHLTTRYEWRARLGRLSFKLFGR